MKPTVSPMTPVGVVISAMLCCVPALPAGTFVYQHAAGFAASGDFDGNGQQDVLLVDKATGLYRIGYTAAGGVMTFAGARPAGMAEVSGVAVGRLNGVSVSSLAVTSPLLNRFHVLTPSTTDYTEPKVQTAFTGIGTTLLGALDIPGAGATPEDDLALVSVLNGANLEELNQFRVNAGAMSLLDNENVPDGAVREGNPFSPAAAAAQLFGYLQTTGTTETFRAWTFTGGNPTVDLTAPGLPAGTSWLAAGLEGAAIDVVFYRPGTPALSLRRVNPSGGGWAFAPAADFVAPLPVAEIVPVNSPAGGRLLVRATNGSLTLFPYTLTGGFGAPSGISVTGAPGVLTGLLPMPGNAFRLLYAAAAGQPPTAIVPFDNPGSGWIQGATIPLPALNSFDIHPNLFILSGPLFRSEDPDLLRTFRAADWSTGISVPGAAPFLVTGQSGEFVSSSAGIGAPSPVNVGTLSSGAPATGTNQVHPQFSFYTFETTLGTMPESVTIDPTPGAYDHAIQISFSGIGAGAQVFYRTSPTATFSAWSAAAAPWLVQAATVDYYIMSGTNAAPVQHATYGFTKPPARQDQDGDGVPDFVEIARGLNPAGGSDSDGDGYSDLTELRDGTNPTLNTSHPSSQPAPTISPLVDVRPQLRLIDGTPTGTVALDTPVHLADPAGTILGSGTVAADGAARFALRDLSPEMGYAVVRTEAHFRVLPAPAGVNRGNEMLAVVPALPQESWSYGITNGTTSANESWTWGSTNFSEGSPDFPIEHPATSTGPQLVSDTWSALQDDPTWGANLTGSRSAASWITQYQAATSTTARPYLDITVSPESTLRALMVEEIASRFFAPVLGGDALQPFTLTADRAPDRAGRTPRRNDASTLRTANPANLLEARFRMLNLLRHVDALNIASKARVERISREIYAATPGETSAAPLDALRQYVRTGVIPAAYRAAVSESDAQLAASWNQLQTLRDSTPARPLQSITLRRTTANGTNPWLLTNPLDGTQVALITPTGLPYLSTLYQLPEVGDEVLCTCYSDTPVIGGFISVEPLSLTYQTITWTFADTDSDNDLLGDGWELRYFGTTANSGEDQRDGSAYSLLQEYFESTVPTDAASSPAAAPVPMTLSQLRMTNATAGQLAVCVNWPAAYTRFVQIGFNESGNLAGFSEVSGLGQEFAPGQFRLIVNPATAPRRFFLPFARLKR